MKKEEKRLIEIIRDVLAGKNKSEWSMQISKEEIERVIKCARVHGVLPFLQECPVFMEEPYREKLFFYIIKIMHTKTRSRRMRQRRCLSCLKKTGFIVCR